jgi:hypothetical protein
MPGFVKTISDERKWKRAKEIAREQGVKHIAGRNKKQSFYAFTTYLFKRMKNSKKK